MTTTFEYTSTFSIRLPEGAHMALEEEFEDAATNRLEGLFPEAVTLWHEGGGTKQNWVYLAPAEEQWSGGWYHMDNLPEGWDNATPEILHRLAAMRGNRVRLFIEGVEVRFVNSTWEGVGIN